MTFVEALDILRNKPPGNLTTAEFHALKAFVEQNPTVWSVVGGREVVDRYLQDAEQAQSSPREAEDARAGEGALSQPFGVASNRGALFLTAVALVLLAGLAALWGWPRFAPSVAQRPVGENGPQPDKGAAENRNDNRDFASPEARLQSRPPGELLPGEATTRPLAQSSADRPPANPIRDMPTPSPNANTPTWLGWKLTLDSAARYEQHTQWDLSDAAQPRPQNLLSVVGGRSELSAVQEIGDRHWLRIVVAEVAPQGDGGEIEVSVDGQVVARTAVRTAGAYLVPLEILRGKKVKLSVAHLPGRQPGKMVWDSVALAANKAAVAWTPLTPDKMETSSGAQLTLQSDTSVLATGPNSAAEQYLITATMPHFDVRAVRLEALSDASLPKGGPGRGAQGDFNLTGFSASLTEADERRDQVPGRYVRIELPGDNRQLVLSEVEVFAGGKNVALRQATAQSSVAGTAFSERAVDGISAGKFDPYRPTTVMHTSPSKPDPCWWEVDLGREVPIERIVFYNGRPEQPTFTANHRLVILDMQREVVWQHLNPQSAHPSIVYGPFITNKTPVEFRTAIERTLTARVERPALVHPGSSPGSGTTAEVCDLYFPLSRFDGDEGKVRLAGRQITFRIQHASPVQQGDQGAVDRPQNLGRFRLSVTPDLMPSSPEPPSEVLALLPEAAKIAGSAAQGTKVVKKNPPAAPTMVATAKVPKSATDAAQKPSRELNSLPLGYAWEGWTVEAEPGAIAAPRFLWDPSLSDAPRLQSRFTTGGKEVKLIQTRQIDAASAWFCLLVGQPDTAAPAGKIEVRVDGRVIARFAPQLLEGEPMRLVSLEPYVGRRVKLELAHVPSQENQQENQSVEWDIPQFAATPQAAGYVEWKVLEPVAVSARYTTQFKILPDHSILAVGDNPAGDTYLVNAKFPDIAVTAVRLEVLPDTSLPMNGPGRGDRGSFNMGKFSAELIDPARKPQTHRGRFVRLELLGGKRSLTMSELEVFAEGKNVALRKPAQQSTVMFGGTADLAVDGLIGNGSNLKGVGFAHTDDTAPLTWWEVDLGAEFPIERLVVWNRQWSGNDFVNYKVAILNPQRGVVWEHVEPDFPVPSTAFEFPHLPRPVRFETADVSFDDRLRSGVPPNPKVILRPAPDQGVQGWHVRDVPGRMQAATFTLAPGQNLAGQAVQFQLGQFTPLNHNLGRIRLSVTAASGPHIARRAMVIEPTP